MEKINFSLEKDSGSQLETWENNVEVVQEQNNEEHDGQEFVEPPITTEYNPWDPFKGLLQPAE